MIVDYIIGLLAVTLVVGLIFFKIKNFKNKNFCKKNCVDCDGCFKGISNGTEK